MISKKTPLAHKHSKSVIKAKRRSRAPDTVSCPIVAIGASAGGLEAFSDLLSHMPADTGFGFVLVQHLDPEHESALAAILARTTRMTVREVTNNLRVLADNVYVIPPNTSLVIRRGVLALSQRARSREAPRSIDTFFESLARDQGPRAIGVILSGNASDGTLGLEAIKAAGGFTFAQDKSARFDSMPTSAVAAGCVDYVLSTRKIAAELTRFARHPYIAGRPGPRSPKRTLGLSEPSAPRFSPAAGMPHTDPGYRVFHEILLMLRNHCGVDFSLYKPSTIQRRIARRSVLNRRPSIKSYADFLRGNTKELDALYADALINVTSFFRNAEAYAALSHLVIARLLAEGGSEPIRVWVLGCSTGQEAYSIAILHMELAERFPNARKLQIFATDLSDANLAKARGGYYPKTLLQDVSPERLRRFFSEEGKGYRVTKQMRESIVFARQNLISDPPFSRIDLISCRNVMIYLEPSLQRKVIPMFHYALNKGGYLFLGASESVGGFSELFAAANRKQKIFVRKAAPARSIQLPTRNERPGRRLGGPRAPFAPAETAAARVSMAAAPRELNAEREADRITVNEFAPPGVLVDANFQVLQFRGRTGAYLEAPAGKATFDLLRMAREGLMLPLRAAINASKEHQRTIRREGIELVEADQVRLVSIEVIPLRHLKEDIFLVLFGSTRAQAPSEQASPGSPGSAGAEREDTALPRAADAARISRLERDLSDTSDYLQSIQERQEASNEELQSTNEEGQSANEELQSLNEELETSKEELESTNEELTTLNEEMEKRNSELKALIERRSRDEAALRASDKRFRALFESEPVGVYSCDKWGRIVEFNRSAAKMWGRSPRVGSNGEKFCGSMRMHRPNGAFMPHARCPMAAILKGTIDAAKDLEVVIERPDSSRITVIVNIISLKNDVGEITGAINCFYDVTERKRTETALALAQEKLSKHADNLEGLVFARTAQIKRSNAQLVVSERNARNGEQKYHALFAASEVMQGKLRHLTRLILTVQEKERVRISRDLHDEVLQKLIVINMELARLARDNAAGDDVLKSKIAAIQKLVECSVDATHDFAKGLRPAVLDDLGLVPAVHAVARDLTARKHMTVKITSFAGAESLEPDLKTVLFRVAHEAITNVVRHAKATAIDIGIEKIGTTVRMRIRDNGKSFSVDKRLRTAKPNQMGIIGMRERTEMVGGNLWIESIRGKGTVVQATVPFIRLKAPRKTKNR